MIIYNMMIDDIRTIRFYKKNGYFFCDPDVPHKISFDIDLVVRDLIATIIGLPFLIVLDLVLLPFELVWLLLYFLIKHCCLKKKKVRK